MKLVAREHAALFVVSAEAAGGRGGTRARTGADPGREVDLVAKQAQTNASALTISHSLFSLGAGQTQSTRETETECRFRLAGPPEQQFCRM